jgi:mannosyltransferase
LVVAIATAAMMAWGLNRPALWLDECASAVATQRSWHHLLKLLWGADSPLVPYYIMLKLESSTITKFAPHAMDHREVLFRWPSAAVMVLGVWALTVWLAKRAPARLVLSTAAVLLATGGITRYGQEARPYAFVMVLAVFCTITWTRLISDGRRRWVALYPLVVAMMITAHLLAGSLVAAHVVAAFVVSPKEKRRAAVMRTAISGAIGMLIISPYALFAAAHAKGATRSPTFTINHLETAFLHLFTLGQRPFLGLGAILLLSILGATRVFDSNYRFVARVALAWALVPPAVLLPIVMVKTNLLIGRYLMFVVPGWAILGGLGVVTLMDLARMATTRLSTRVAADGRPVLAPSPVRSALSRPRVRSILAGSIASVIGIAVLAATFNSQGPTLKMLRGPSGHSEDIRPALAFADLPANARLPIAMSSRFGAIEIAAYDRKQENRMIALREQRILKTIWPSVGDPADRKEYLRTHPQLLLFERSAPSLNCSQPLHGPTLNHINRCMPTWLKIRGYHAVESGPTGSSWIYAILVRTTGPGTGKPAASATTKSATKAVKPATPAP